MQTTEGNHSLSLSPIQASSKQIASTRCNHSLLTLLESQADMGQLDRASVSNSQQYGASILMGKKKKEKDEKE